MVTWLISDTHFNHLNILQYCSKTRPFKDISHMNETLIANWNSRVSNKDIVYHLGDFLMGPRDRTKEFADRLNGTKILVLGNHDKEKYCKEAFLEVHKELTLLMDNYVVHLRHYPLGGHEGTTSEQPGNWDFLLHGHTHGRWVNRGSEIDVGVDAQGLFPKTFEELTKGIEPRQFTSSLEKHHNLHRGL